jgi:hypothetical protein
MANAFLDYYDEMKATGDRLTHASQRLNAVASAIRAKDGSAKTGQLEELAKLPGTFSLPGPSGSTGMLPAPQPAKKKSN